jgi:hypothetical protein
LRQGLNWPLAREKAALTASNDRSDDEIARLFDHCTALREARDGFDAMFGTRTSGIYEQGDLPDSFNEDRSHCSRYHPAPIASFNEALARLIEIGVRFDSCSFVDVGSGLGRNLLLAANHPFRSITGVEISETLHAQAVLNVETAGSRFPYGDRIRLIRAHAHDFRLPPGDLVLWFWEPFDGHVARSFIDALVSATVDRTVQLVFLNNRLEGVDDSDRLELVDLFETSDTAYDDQPFVVSIVSSVRRRPVSVDRNLPVSTEP